MIWKIVINSIFKQSGICDDICVWVRILDTNKFSQTNEKYNETVGFEIACLQIKLIS